MRGGNLRFQAQYLRRIRIPDWANVSEKLRAKLRKAAVAEDRVLAEAAVKELYGFDDAAWARLGQAGQPADNSIKP